MGSYIQARAAWSLRHVPLQRCGGLQSDQFASDSGSQTGPPLAHHSKNFQGLAISDADAKAGGVGVIDGAETARLQLVANSGGPEMFWNRGVLSSANQTGRRSSHLTPHADRDGGSRLAWLLNKCPYYARLRISSGPDSTPEIDRWHSPAVINFGRLLVIQPIHVFNTVSAPPHESQRRPRTRECRVCEQKMSSAKIFRARRMHHASARFRR